MNEKMRAVVVRAPMQFDLEEVSIPAVPPGGMLVKVQACALCGSDLRTLRSGHRRVTFPWIIGHELCGTVFEVGKNYSGPWKKGEIIAVGPVAYCGRCDFCLTGRYELCTDYREIAQEWPGGFADFIAIPEECVRLGTIQRVPKGLDPAFAAITEPISSCIHAHEKCRIDLGDTIVIIGAGPVGCIHMMLARLRGADKIFLVDTNQDRLHLSEAFEPDELLDATKIDLIDEVKKLTNGMGADVVITATPAPIAVVQAVEIAKKGGRILIFGGLPINDSKPPVDINTVHYKGLFLIGITTFAPRHQILAIRLVNSKRLQIDKLITHRFPLSEFKQGALLALEGKVLKGVFFPK